MKSIGIGTIVHHQIYGRGVIYSITLQTVMMINIDGKRYNISRDDNVEIIEYVNNVEDNIAWDDVRNVIHNAIREFSDTSEIVALGQKWQKGLLILKPFDTTLKPKEIPIEQFFHKIVMLRDRLRVLEQNINAHKLLTDEDKINLQQYITRCYGSLTTFNVFFAQKEDNFIGVNNKE